MELRISWAELTICRNGRVCIRPQLGRIFDRGDRFQLMEAVMLANLFEYVSGHPVRMAAALAAHTAIVVGVLAAGLVY